MTLKSNDHATTTNRKKRIAKHRGNGVINDARQDVDVIRMVSAEIDKRVAAHHARIADAAYFRAKKRGFEPGHELDDWLAAEAEVAHAAQS